MSWRAGGSAYCMAGHAGVHARMRKPNRDPPPPAMKLVGAEEEGVSTGGVGGWALGPFGAPATAAPRDGQARLGTDGPASGRAVPPWDRQARLGTDGPPSGQTGPPQLVTAGGSTTVGFRM